jgi:hypothetical protein
MHHALAGKPPPDIAPFAHSAATRAADEAAARRSSARLADLTSALPWAAPLGTSVADSCRTLGESTFVGETKTWSTISCVRTSVLYVAFDGDVRSRLRQLDAALAAQGWAAQDGAQATLSAQNASRQSPAAPPQPGIRPATQSTCVQQTYAPAAQRGRTGVVLTASVAEYPCRPTVPTGDAQAVGPPQKSSGEGVLYLDWRPLWTQTVADRAFAAHRYLAAFSLVDRYATQSPTAHPPSPAR